MGVATATAVVGLGVAGYQAYQGAKEKKDAKRALESKKRQELKNVYEDERISTRGSDLQKEQQSKLEASQIETLAGAGVRGIIGGLGRVEAGSQASNRRIGADLDMQQKQLDQKIASDEASIRGVKESRDIADISALSSQYSAGNQQMWQGIGGMTQSAMSGISAQQPNQRTATSKVKQSEIPQQQPNYRVGKGNRYNENF